MKKTLTVILTLFTSLSYGQTNFQRYFDRLNLKGSTTIYDYKNKEWFYTNEHDANIATLPASTFKILNSLIALEHNAVKDENEVFKWDGKPKSHFGSVVNVWNKDSDLKNAYKNSTVWFYVEIAKKIERSLYWRILNQCEYGNGDLSEKGSDFWNYGNFAIDPKNQIEFLIKLQENKLPFSKKHMDVVKEIMISEKINSQVFRGKTGWTRHNGQDIGWWVGYLEVKGNVYFFATRLIKDVNEFNPNFLPARKQLTKAILAEVIN